MNSQYDGKEISAMAMPADGDAQTIAERTQVWLPAENCTDGNPARSRRNRPMAALLANGYEQARSVARTEIAVSPREYIVLKLICRGLSNKQIARELRIAPETVKSHAAHILAKFQAKTRAAAVAHAFGLGLIEASTLM
jgi:ATP/maltotriose-dependent transcriptional regulator MalT